eukprot:gene15027-17226_t
MSVFNDCCSFGLAGLVALPQVLQDSFLDYSTGALINLFLLSLAFFGKASLIASVVVLVTLALAYAYHLLNGAKYMRILFAYCRRKDRVYPSDQLHNDDDILDQQPEGSPAKYAASASVDLFGSSQRNSAHRVGLFEQQQRVQLLEGPWRTVTYSVTRPRTLRSLSEMNRMFGVETPIDQEITQYGREGDVLSVHTDRSVAGDERKDDDIVYPFNPSSPSKKV